MFHFSFIYVDRPDDSYYLPRWDLAKPIDVVAETERDAINKAAAALGEAGSHRHWVFDVKAIRDVALLTSEPSEVTK